MANTDSGRVGRMTPYLSRTAVWAFAVGTSVGWGSMVVTGNTYLVQAGPLGSSLGLLLGGLIMCLICRNYAYLVGHYPGAGGVYSYTKRINDTLGHQAGDRYIQDAGTLICEYYKHSPVYRIGGDEFVILPEGKDFERRQDILKEINRVVESHIGTDNVVVSLGMAESDGGDAFRTVFERADALMYERKQQLKSMGAVTRD